MSVALETLIEIGIETKDKYDAHREKIVW